MKNIKITIEYDGTGYHGWQSQINALAVQDVISAAIKKLTGEDIKLAGASRTDTGVHAFGQVANFFTASSIPPEKYAYALNTVLPEQIVVVKSEEVDTTFHARYSAVGKKYRYLIYNSDFPSALLRHRAYHITHPLDIDVMQQAARYFLGTHDFQAFSATGGNVISSIRTISEIAINKNISINKNEETIRIEITGDGFLYNMVRIIAGTLVEAGFGKIKPEEIPSIIDDLDRKKAGKTAPAHGLYLVEVYY